MTLPKNFKIIYNFILFDVCYIHRFSKNKRLNIKYEFKFYQILYLFTQHRMHILQTDCQEWLIPLFKDLLFLCQPKAENFMMIMMIFSWRNLVNLFCVNLLWYKKRLPWESYSKIFRRENCKATITTIF